MYIKLKAKIIWHTTVLRCLHKEKLHPSIHYFVQELTELRFRCKNRFLRKLLNRNGIVLGTTFLTNQHFTLNGKVNRQNCGYWLAENPHWMRETRTQDPPKVNVWAGIIGENIIVLIYIALIDNKYLSMIRDEVVSGLANLYSNTRH